MKDHSSLSKQRSVKTFYDDNGWKLETSGRRTDYTMWEDTRPHATQYQSRCRQRLFRYIETDNREILLDIGSGPAQHPEYRDIHASFNKTVLFDLSCSALNSLNDNNYTKVCGTATSLPFSDATFGGIMCVNVINHIEKDVHRAVVLEAIRVLKHGKSACFVSYNPDRLVLSKQLAKIPVLRSVYFKKIRDRESNKSKLRNQLFYAPPSIVWWNTFADVASVKIHPIRFLFVSDSITLIPDGIVGSLLFRIMSFAEDVFPKLCLKGAYYAVVLRKK